MKLLTQLSKEKEWRVIQLDNNSLVFEKKYLILQGKEYLVKTPQEEKAIIKKAKRIAKLTGKKPHITFSFRNDFN